METHINKKSPTCLVKSVILGYFAMSLSHPTKIINFKFVKTMTEAQLEELKERFYQLVNHKLGESFK